MSNDIHPSDAATAATSSPLPARRILVTGGDGQLARALRDELGDLPLLEYATKAELDLTDPNLERMRQWSEYGTIINAAAYTRVDEAETPDGRRAAWASNVTAVAALARLAITHRMTLVHFSTDYVFDGTKAGPYTEDDRVAPLSVYGQTKAAADAVVSVVPHHYILRTSWVVGDGKNFIRTMSSLAERGVRPAVVADQMGRLTRASELAATVRLLLSSGARPGLYNVTGAGPAKTWHQIARDVFELNGRDPDDVIGVTTDQYFASAAGPIAPRPRNSVLALDRIESVRRAVGVSAAAGLSAPRPLTAAAG